MASDTTILKMAETDPDPGHTMTHDEGAALLRTKHKDMEPIHQASRPEESIEQPGRPEVLDPVSSLPAGDESNGSKVEPGAEMRSEAAPFHDDIQALSQVASQDDGQFGSQYSSAQDMGTYFSPRLLNQSASTDDLALAQTPPTPVTEWPSAVNLSQSSLTDHNGPAKADSECKIFEASEVTWKDTASQTVAGPTTDRIATTRPTSVPILSTHSTSKRRRDGSEYPVYPDQSFAALQSQSHSRPRQPQPLRTRSSHPSHNSSFSSISSRASRDFSMQPGAKTVGNTPAQSPGLFSPNLPRGRPDDSSRTSVLHSSHLHTPTETHKLLKDIDPVSGRKLINDYELIEKLGSGQHGTVKLGKDLRNGDHVAVKIVRRFSKKLRLGRSGDPSDMIKKEVAILKKARHENVVSLLEVIDDDEWEKVYLVLEYVARGEIVWRKWADKDIAVFEMQRVKREKHIPSTYVLDKEEVERFNVSVPVRRVERQQALQRRKVSSFWSLEHGGEDEEEVEHEASKQIRPYSSATALSPSIHELATAVKIESCREELIPRQLAIPRSVPADADDATPMASATKVEEEVLAKLRLDSSTQLKGTMYGAYDAPENGSDAALSTKLEEIFTSQTHWSEEEEEYQYVPCLTLSQAQDAFRDTVLGLEYLHYQGIIHRDIKPANLLWTTDFRVKISDFGVSYLGKPLREDDDHEEIPEADAAIQKEAIELAKTVGTPAFYAPELCDPELFDLEKNPQRPQITGQIDVWALGVTLYCMIYGRLPFLDHNEMAMYEKIAREDVFISRIRLKGVEKSEEKVTNNSNKRDDDVIEYEEVDDELQDLLRCLLEKNPLKRISIKEVKQHPWVLRGIQDQGAWVDQTDPSVQSEGKKIEVSNEDVQQAVVGLMDRLKGAFRRVGSVVRGRDGRKRTESSAKTPDSPSAPQSKARTSSQDGRRSSLRGDEQIYSALRASREGSEHPLSQSVTASPETRGDRSYFEEYPTTQTVTETPDNARPSLPERTLSNTESIKTIRPIVSMIGREGSSSPPPFSSLTTVVDENSTSSLGAIFGGAGRRFVNSMRSRERERNRDSPSQSSRSSSAGGSSLGVEDPHASPSIAISSAIAAGRVDQPPALREPSPSPSLASQSTQSRIRTGSEAYLQAQEQNYRIQILESARDEPRILNTVPSTVDTPCPLSPDDVSFSGVGISSSSDQIGSAVSESFSHPSVPSMVSGVSSVSASVHGFPTPAKDISPAMPRNVSGTSHYQVDEAGYNGGGEQDSDSDEDMLVMGGKK